MNRLKVQIVMLPTDKESKLHIVDKRQMVIQLVPIQSLSVSKAYNLYLLSDEEINIGDWFYSFKYNTVDKLAYNGVINKDKCKKIIATTDESLSVVVKKPQGSIEPFIRTLLPRPSDALLKKYAESNGSIKECYVETLEIPIQDYADSPTSHLPPIRMMSTNIVKVAPDNTISIFPIKELFTKEDFIKAAEFFYTLGREEARLSLLDKRYIDSYSYHLNQFLN